MVQQQEMVYWKRLSATCMSDESDNEEGTKTRHTAIWRSESK